MPYFISQIGKPANIQYKQVAIKMAPMYIAYRSRSWGITAQIRRIKSIDLVLSFLGLCFDEIIRDVKYFYVKVYIILILIAKAGVT